MNIKDILAKISAMEGPLARQLLMTGLAGEEAQEERVFHCGFSFRPAAFGAGSSSLALLLNNDSMSRLPRSR